MFSSTIQFPISVRSSTDPMPVHYHPVPGRCDPIPVHDDPILVRYHSNTCMLSSILTQQYQWIFDIKGRFRWREEVWLQIGQLMNEQVILRHEWNSWWCQCVLPNDLWSLVRTGSLSASPSGLVPPGHHSCNKNSVSYQCWRIEAQIATKPISCLLGGFYWGSYRKC